MNTAVKERVSPGAAALEWHMRRCTKCRAVAIANAEAVNLCPAGQVLAVATYRARARRAAS